MALRIDLVPKEAEQVKKVNIAVRSLTLISRVLAVVFILAIAGLFGWYFLVQYQVGQVKAQVEAATAQVAESSAQELKYRLYQDILNQASGVIKERTDYKGIFDDLFSLLPPQAGISGLVFNGDILQLSIKTLGVQDFGRVLDNVEQIRTGKVPRFTTAAVTSISRSGDTIYTFRLEIGMTKPK